MKNLVKSILLVLALSLALPTAATAAEQPQSVIVLTQTLHEGFIDFQYPKLVGMLDTTVQRKINTAITNWLDRVLAESSTPETLTAMVRYQVHYNKDGMLSLTLKNYVYTGGAHGMTYLRGMTFDLASGREYLLSDIIPYKNGGRDRINAEINHQLNNSKIPLLSQFKSVQDRQNFYINSDGKAVVFFQLYELAPYVYGFLEFPINP